MKKHARPRNVCAAALLLGMGGATVAACNNPTTEIVAGMTTQIQVSKDLAAVGVLVRYGGQLVSCRTYPLVDGAATLPATLGVAPQEAREGEVLEPVTVTVVGFRTAKQGEDFDASCLVEPAADAPEVVVIRSKRMPYVDERILYLPMPLRESCTGVVCGENETCLGGVCEDNLVDPETAVEFNDSLIFGNTNTCFSPKVCLPAGVTQAAVLTNPDTCEFRYPVPPGEDPPETTLGNLNVEIVYHSMGTEILDLDEKEGFVLDESDPLKFRLAENLCESNYKTGKILGVFMAPVCPAKPALQPICDEDLKGIQSGDRSPKAEGSSVDEPLCTVGDALTPSESALYVLLDRSASMEDLYGPDGLEFAVGVPLRNPVSARTRVGFSFLPADQQACTDGSFESPDFGFDDVEVVRGPIAEALGDAANTLLSDDPQLFLDGAMLGAYDALAALTLGDSARFNRRALIIVGNRDLQAHCPAAETPASLAATALADDNIFTYAVVLKAPASAQQFGDDPQASAAAIATAGGTEVFDAVADENEGPLAVQKVLNDLGSCVYDPASPLVEQAGTHLSYVNPINLERTDIARNDECNGEAASESVDGWGIDAEGGGVRICGAPCAALRDTLTDTATFFAVLGEPAPRIPIVTALPCSDPSRFEAPNAPQ